MPNFATPTLASNPSARPLAAVVALTVLALRAHAAQSQIVLPGDQEHVEAPDGNRYPFGDVEVVRYQQAYDAQALAPILGEKIGVLAFRLDANADAPSPGFVYGNVRLTLSTKEGLVDALSHASMDDNVGPDAVVVYDGPYTMPPLGTGPGPNPFDFRFELQKALLYTGGDLLLDVVLEAPVPDWWYLDSTNSQTDAVSRAWHDASSTGADGRGLITEITTGSGPPKVLPMSDCGGNAGTLTHVSGAPTPGAVLSVAMDDGQALGAVGHLAFAVQPVTGWPPCGLPLADLGELLIDPAPPTPVAMLGGTAAWTGAPMVFTYPLPTDLSLVGSKVYQQGLWVDVAGLAPGEPLRLTDGLVLQIGF